MKNHAEFLFWGIKLRIMVKTENVLSVLLAQKDRKVDHLEEFLNGFQEVCVTDGYQAYHSLEEKTPEIFAGTVYLALSPAP